MGCPMGYSIGYPIGNPKWPNTFSGYARKREIILGIIPEKSRSRAGSGSMLPSPHFEHIHKPAGSGQTGTSEYSPKQITPNSKWGSQYCSARRHNLALARCSRFEGSVSAFVSDVLCWFCVSLICFVCLRVGYNKCKVYV